MGHNKLLIGVFDTEEKILKAAQAARAAGMTAHDAFTPYPVHGMDEALELKPSWLMAAGFVFGVTGFTLILAFMYWVSLFNWPLNIGGKSYHASPALIPIAFEITILFAGVGTTWTFFALRRYFPGRKPYLWELGGIDDKFLLAFREGPEGAGKDSIGKFLKEHGELAVEERGANR
ncbi:MAG: DUF3341 domain-containing protein [Elusimicrobia bacterium]|nr:DUF3341 domain-containing protein [Elusimicrobiota bacterium]